MTGQVSKIWPKLYSLSDTINRRVSPVDRSRPPDRPPCFAFINRGLALPARSVCYTDIMVSSDTSGIAFCLAVPNQDSRMDAVIKHYGDTMMVRSSVKRLSVPILLFIAGSALIGAAFATLWLGWPWSPQDEDTHLVFLPISVAVVIIIALMSTWGSLANGHRMWVSFVLVSVLLMAHSIL